MKLRIEYLPNYNRDWGELGYKHADDSGFDLRAAIDAPVSLAPGEKILIANGIRVDFQAPFPFGSEVGYEIQVRPRSGLAAKFGISIVNTPGTVDFGYRGEIKTTLVNLGTEPFVINPGDRIAQAVVCPILHPEIVITSSVDENTTRGAGGFGSTGRA